MKTNPSQSNPLYMGLFCHGSHDAAVAIVNSEGELLFASEQERFDRKKHSSAFPAETILAAFKELNISWNQIEAVGFAWSPWLSISKAVRVLASNPWSLKDFLFHPKQSSPSRLNKFSEMMKVRSRLKEMGWPGKNFKFLNHHECHAASSFFLSGFPSAACLTVDGNGEIDSTTIHHFSASKKEKVFEKKYPQSLGHFYASITQYLGFKPMNDEYKVMGLASFKRLDPDKETLGKIKSLLTTEQSYSLDESFFAFQRGQDQMWSPKLEELLGAARIPGTPVGEKEKNIAAAAQLVLEESMLALSSLCKKLLPHENSFCLSGGVALNCVANERLVREGGWGKIFIPPSPHDSGSAVGAAFLIREKYCSNRSLPKIALSAYLGTRPEVSKTISTQGERRKLSESIPWLADALSRGKIVAWCRGRAEFGPRALGNRSVLADPRTPESKQRLNLIIKKRESFRPFAPIVVESEAENYFDMGMDKTSPFMLRTVPALSGWESRIPAACHVDGSARVQTLNENVNPVLFQLLMEFAKITGIPILLNTSMNQSEEPIVNSAEEAVRFYNDTEVDILVLENEIWIK